MGQGRSKEAVYAVQDLQHQPVSKAGSLTSLTFSKVQGGRRGSIKRTQSFRDNKAVQEQMLREKLEREAKELDRWAHERSQKWRHIDYVVPRLDELAAVAVAKCLRAPMDVEALPIPRLLKDAVEFRLSPTFDESIADEKVVFTNGDRSIQYTGKGYSTTAMKMPMGRGMSHGRHAWIIRIDTSRVQGWTQVGVVDEERYRANCRTPWDGNPHPHRRGEIARRNNGNFHSGRSELEATMVHESIFLGGYGQGDTIAVKVDFDTKELQWMKNGEDYGSKVPFDAQMLYPSVSLDSPGEGATIAYYTGPVAL